MTISNAGTFDDLAKVAKELGADSAKGADSQAKWDMKVLEAAERGVIDLVPNKHGTGFDDATKLAEHYFSGRNASVIFDHREGRQRKLASNTRTLIRCGSDPRFGANEPMQTVNKLVSFRQEYRKKGNGKRLEDVHNLLIKFATKLRKLTVLPSDDELRAMCFRAEAEPRTAQEWWNSIQKQAQKLKKGVLSNCPDIDQSAEIDAVLTACRDRLTKMAQGTP